METFILTENGSTHINKNHSDANSTVYTTGVLGTATATVSYMNRAGGFVPFSDGVLVVNDQIPVSHGIGVDIYVVVAGADGTTAIEIMCAASD